MLLPFISLFEYYVFLVRFNAIWNLITYFKFMCGDFDLAVTIPFFLYLNQYGYEAYFKVSVNKQVPNLFNTKKQFINVQKNESLIKLEKALYTF